MRRVGVLAVIVVVGLTRGRRAAQRRGGGGRLPPTGAIEKVKDNLYVIHGGTAGNTTVFLTQAGVVLVDTKLANSGEAIMNQVKTVTDKPVSMIINTHSHPGSHGEQRLLRAHGREGDAREHQEVDGEQPAYAKIRRRCPPRRSPTR